MIAESPSFSYGEYVNESQYDILEEKAKSINLSIKDYIKARL